MKEAMKLALEALGQLWLFSNEAAVIANPAIKALREALAEQPAPVQGWKLVPVEPTQKMLDAPPNAYPADALVTWKAMLAAAPQPPAQQEPVTWGVDWGQAGQIPCVSIIKRLPGGGIEVVAVEYAPYEYNPPAQRTWVEVESIRWEGTKLMAKLKEKNT